MRSISAFRREHFGFPIGFPTRVWEANRIYSAGRAPAHVGTCIDGREGTVLEVKCSQQTRGAYLTNRPALICSHLPDWGGYTSPRCHGHECPCAENRSGTVLHRQGRGFGRRECSTTPIGPRAPGDESPLGCRRPRAAAAVWQGRYARRTALCRQKAHLMSIGEIGAYSRAVACGEPQGGHSEIHVR